MSRSCRVRTLACQRAPDVSVQRASTDCQYQESYVLRVGLTGWGAEGRGGRRGSSGRGGPPEARRS
eukprot:2127434-Rhodomonas_salina.1